MTLNDRSQQPWFRVLIMLGLLAAVGLYSHLSGQSVYWPGFISMMVFYALIFYFGSYAASFKKSDSAGESMLAGRAIPLGIAVFTMSATWVGGGYINGTAESTYASGLVWAQAPWGYAISLVLGGIFFARKMRRLQYSTMLDPLEQRYGKKMAAVLFIPALSGEIFWTAAILTALGTTFGTVLGLDFSSSIIVSAIIAIAYTAVGGLWAVALTDVVQLLLLFIGLGAVLPFALSHVGGLHEAWTEYTAQKGSMSSLMPPLDGWKEEKWGYSFWNWWDYALLLMLGGIPWQVYFQRVLSSKDPNTAMRLSILAGGVCLLAAIPSVLIGVAGSVVDWQAAGAQAPSEPALVLPYVVRYLTNPVVATVGLGAIAAAVMSSVDSSILSASSMASWNVYKPLIKPKSDAKALAKVIRRSIWIIGISAMLLALRIKSVYALWFLCSDFVYTILFPQLVTALFDKKANRYGSIAGLAVAFILRFGGGEPALNIPRLIPYPMINEEGVVLFPFRTLAMVAGLVTIMVVSRLTQRSCPAEPLEKMEQ